jgi:hypothetical protein
MLAIRLFNKLPVRIKLLDTHALRRVMCANIKNKVYYTLDEFPEDDFQDLWQSSQTRSL